jgi:hypothetical protein
MAVRLVIWRHRNGEQREDFAFRPTLRGKLVAGQAR